MNLFNKKIINIKKKPILIFKIDNFFDYDFFLDIKNYFPKINHNELNLNNHFGKISFPLAEVNYENKNQQKIFSKLNSIIYSKEFFNFFVKKFFFKNIINQNNYLRKIKYLRYPILDNNENSFFDILFSKVKLQWSFSFIKNNGRIVPHVDGLKKYISLMLYFPNDNNKDIKYGTTFWKSKSPNFSNTHISNPDEEKKFKSNNDIDFKAPFIPNCLYGFLRNDFSWHTVEPLDISNDYVRRSININFIFKN